MIVLLCNKNLLWSVLRCLKLIFVLRFVCGLLKLVVFLYWIIFYLGFLNFLVGIC